MLLQTDVVHLAAVWACSCYSPHHVLLVIQLAEIGSIVSQPTSILPGSHRYPVQRVSLPCLRLIVMTLGAHVQWTGRHMKCQDGLLRGVR
jgi:hypothetical protein